MYMNKFNIKYFGIIFLILVVALTIFVCCFRPQMHKIFQVNVIEYLIKINSDGSMTTTKNTTTTVLQENK